MDADVYVVVGVCVVADVGVFVDVGVDVDAVWLCIQMLLQV